MQTASLDKFGRLVVDRLPSVGDMIDVDDMGAALVECIYHTGAQGTDNYIRLQIQDSPIGVYSQDFKILEW